MGCNLSHARTLKLIVPTEQYPAAGQHCTSLSASFYEIARRLLTFLGESVLLTANGNPLQPQTPTMASSYGPGGPSSKN